MPSEALGRIFRGMAKHVPSSLARAVMTRHVVETCEGLGPEIIDWLIKNGHGLSSLVGPEQVAAYETLASPYRGMDSLVSDEDFWQALPDWTKRIIRDNGEAGDKWFTDTREWIRSFFKEA